MSTQPRGSEPAFPVPDRPEHRYSLLSEWEHEATQKRAKAGLPPLHLEMEHNGISMREFFAAHAPARPVPLDPKDGTKLNAQFMVEWAFEYADAMLTFLNKK